MSNVRDKRLLFKSLQMKLVLIMVLLIVSVMAVVGTFLVNSITNFYVTGFREQMASVFDTETLEQINKIAVGENAGDKIKDVLSAYSTSLGINSYRNFYILDGKTGLVITGSNDALDKDFTQTSNIVTAMTGKVGNKGLASDDYMDVAIPINGDKPYIIYIIDSKNELSDINWTLCTIVIQTMLFALLTAVLLSFLLSKAITNPIENLKKSAKLVAVGDFSHPVEVQSSDEIGELTGTFNEMAAILRDTIEQVQGERDKLNTLFLHMTDGVAAFTSDGKIIHMNYATEKLLEIKFEENLTFNEVFHGMNMPNEIEAEQKGYIQTEIQRENKSLTVLFARYGNESDGGIMAVIRDITEQKKLEDSRREFVANVSHELRTPITNIKSYTETIIDSGSDLPQETTLKFLGVIESEADRMARIVKDLLTLSRLDYGRMDVKFDKFSMKELIHDVYQAMILEAGNCGHKLITDVGTDPIYIVEIGRAHV